MGASCQDQEQVLPDPEVSPLLGGAPGSAETDVQECSLCASEEGSGPDEVLARPVSTPRLVCASPEEEVVLGEVWLVCARMLVNAGEETQVEAVGSRGGALLPPLLDRSEESALWLMLEDV